MNWNENSEFEVLTPDGEKVMVEFESNWMKDSLDMHHMVFHGLITNTGYRRQSSWVY